jgi:hypothetical protein
MEVNTMRKGKYYILPLDNYRQPRGNIEEIYLTKNEKEQMEKENPYIFKKYASALLRAQD